MGGVSRPQFWRAGCHGRLLRLAAPASPERTQVSSAGRDTPGAVVETLAEIAETIFGVVT